MTLQSAPLSSAAPTLSTPRSARVSTVEFWRFAFTILVCIYHAEMFFGGRKLLQSGSSAVEFFFVLAGFLIAKSAKSSLAGRTEPVSVKEAASKAAEFVKKKLKAFYPVLIIVLLLGILVYPTVQTTFADRLQNLKNSEWELLMMVGTPFGYNNGGTPIVPLWFLTSLLVIGYVYTFALHKNYDFMMFAAPVIGVLFYIYFTLNSSLVLDFYIKMGFFNAGMVRAIAEMAFGISMFGLYDYLSKKKFGIYWQIILTLFEAYAIYRLFDLMFYEPVGMDNFIRVVYINIIILLSFLNAGFISKILNRRIWSKLTSLSFTMYLCHFHLINVYLKLLREWKAYLLSQARVSESALAIWRILENTGGMDSKYKAIPMGLKDMIMFIALVMVVSALIELYILFWKKMIVRPLMELYKTKQLKKAEASWSDKEEVPIIIK